MAALTSVSSKIGKRGFPSLRQHATGVYFWREKGKDRYCGSDHAAAQRAWLEYFAERLVPVATPQETATPFPTPKVSAPVMAQAVAAPAVPMVVKGRTVADLARKLQGQIDGQCTPARARVYRFEMAPFVERFGTVNVSELEPSALLAYRSELVKKYKPWTVNGRLCLIRRLLALADTLGWDTARVDSLYRLSKPF